MNKWILLLLLIPFSSALTDSPSHYVELASATAADIAGNGVVIMGRTDPLGQDGLAAADANVWVMWNQFGQQIRTGHADRDGCATMVIDPCIAHVVDVEIDNTGTRVIVAANNPGIGARLIFITEAQGEFRKIEVSDEIQDLHASDDLTSIVIATDAGVKAFTWSIGSNGSPGIVDEAGWEHELSPLLASDYREGTFVGLSEDGFHRIQGGELLTFSLPKPGVAVATGEDWSAVSLDDGRIRLYGPKSNQAPNTQSWEFHSTSKVTTALEFSPDETRFLAASDVLRTYANPILDPDVERILEVESSVPSSMEWTQEEQWIATGRMVEARLNSSFGIWDSELPADVPEFTGNGLVFGAFSGNKMHVFKPNYDFQIDSAGKIVGAPDATPSTNWTFKNNGNRIIQVASTYSGPFGVSVPASMNLLPGQETIVELEATIPSGSIAGSFEGTVRAVATGDAPISRTVAIEVLEMPGWKITGPQATSLQPGEVAEVDLILTNTGNAPNETSILAASEQQWKIESSVTSVNLGDGESVQLKITIEVPSDATHLAEVDVGIIIPGFTTHKINGVVGGVYGVSLEGSTSESIVVGAVANVEMAITNTGNIDDGYEVTFINVPAGWEIQAQPTNQVLVPSGQTVTIPVQITTSELSPAANYQITVKVLSNSDSATSATAPIKVPAFAPVEETSSQSESSSENTPIPIWLAIAAVGLAFSRKRRN